MYHFPSNPKVGGSHHDEDGPLEGFPAGLGGKAHLLRGAQGNEGLTLSSTISSATAKATGAAVYFLESGL